MPHHQGVRLVNPLVGIYFGIFAACLAAIVVLLLIFEQLGVAERSLRLSMAFGAMVLFAAVGAGAYTPRMRDFANAGRRIPAFYAGLNLTVAALGGAGLTGLSGAMLIAGFDMMFMGLGVIAGLAAMVMLISPYLRKAGAPTLPTYLGERVASGPVRLLAASVAVIPLLLVLIAEIKVAVMALSWLTPLGGGMAAGLVALVLVATVAPGGARSVSWSAAAQALAMLIAVLVPAAIAAVMETNLPFGQLSHGPLLRNLLRTEATQEVAAPLAGLLTLELPGEGLQAVAGRYANAFGNVGPVAFVLGMLTIMAGIAGSPGLLARASITPTVYDTRKSVGWAVVLVGLLLTTFSAIAVFERNILASEIAGQAASAPPPPLRALMDLGLAAVDPRSAQISVTSVAFDRNGALVALPVMLGMPRVVVSLVEAGILAAALAAAASSLGQIGLIVGEDIVNAPESWRASDSQRLIACRIGIVVVAGLGATVAMLVRGDPLLLMLYALVVSGSAIFPVVVLSIWWKRLNAAGTLAGMATGLAVALMAIVAAGFSGLGLPSLLATTIAGPMAVGVAVLVSHLTHAPGRHILEMVRDLRVPGGETLHDREIRQARQRTTGGN